MPAYKEMGLQICIKVNTVLRMFRVAGPPHLGSGSGSLSGRTWLLFFLGYNGLRLVISLIHSGLIPLVLFISPMSTFCLNITKKILTPPLRPHFVPAGQSASEQ
jgi:hypothetical protein